MEAVLSNTSAGPRVVGTIVSMRVDATLNAALRWHTFSFPVISLQLVEFFWRDMIKDILPKGNNGTVLVFHNPW
jgi:hypothetical protein